MKLTFDPNFQSSVSRLQEARKGPQRTTFETALADAVSRQSGLPGASGPETGAISQTSALGSFAAGLEPLETEVERLIDGLEAYRSGLADSKRPLESLEPALRSVSEMVRRVRNGAQILPQDHPLKDIADEGLRVAMDALAHFARASRG